MTTRSRVACLLPVLLIALLCLAPSPALAAGYGPFFRPFRDADRKLWVAIRRFDEGGRTRYLAVDPASFGTAVMDEASAASDADETDWKGTAFSKALERYNAPALGLQDGGLRRGPSGGLFLTIDLCPSSNRADAALFNAAVDMAAARGVPTPVAIAVSGLWMERHPGELEWILGLEKKGGLAITWVNHTWSHPYDKGRPLAENFLLKPGVDFEREVLDDELAMIRRGLVPSPFFRFPGLVADRGLLERLKRLFLIPIGADAWLAKGERPAEGSIILVHGNGNEPEGVRRFMELYRASSPGGPGGPGFLPLRDALAGPLTPP